MSMSDYVKRLRQKRRWRQRDLAQRAGWHQSKVSRIELGQREPTFADLETLASVFGRPLAEVVKVRAGAA